MQTIASFISSMCIFLLFFPEKLIPFSHTGALSHTFLLSLSLSCSSYALLNFPLSLSISTFSLSFLTLTRAKSSTIESETISSHMVEFLWVIREVFFCHVNYDDDIKMCFANDKWHRMLRKVLCLFVMKKF